MTKPGETLAAPRPLSMTQEELEALDRANEEAARKLQEADVTCEQVVEEVMAYVHKLRER
ncbi:MAG: hypothetical protein AB1609_08865 [Bacillota bacterium]